jgi:DNA polymerase III delta prime subunit
MSEETKTYSGVDYGIVGMSPIEVRNYIVNTFTMAQKLGWPSGPDSIYIEGPPGVGKTFSAYAAARDVGAIFKECPVKSIMMSAIEPTDIVGTPWRHGEHPYTEYLPLRWAWDASVEYEEHMREKLGDPTWTAPPMFLFFDDFVVAHEQVQAAGHKLFHEKMAGDLTIRPNVLLLAAGNRPEDNAAAVEMKTAMASRFRWVYFNLTTDDWLTWARDEGKVHPLVCTYIHQNRQSLHTFEPNAVEKAFACPRTMEMLSRALFENEQMVKDAIASEDESKESDFFKIAAGIVGSGTANEFTGFMDKTQKAIPIEVILKDPKKAPFPKLADIDALHATMESIGYYVKNEHPELWKPILTYAIRDDHPLKELAIILAAKVVQEVRQVYHRHGCAMNYDTLRDLLNCGQELAAYMKKEDELLRTMYHNGRKGINPTEKQHGLQVSYSSLIRLRKAEFVQLLKEMGFRR